MGECFPWVSCIPAGCFAGCVRNTEACLLFTQAAPPHCICSKLLEGQSHVLEGVWACLLLAIKQWVVQLQVLFWQPTVWAGTLWPLKVPPRDWQGKENWSLCCWLCHGSSSPLPRPRNLSHVPCQYPWNSNRPTSVACKWRSVGSQTQQVLL